MTQIIRCPHGCDDTITTLRAEVERLTGERDKARVSHSNLILNGSAKINAAIARAEKAEAALSGSIGYMMNAAIDLETGAPKKTALATINGGIKMARAALASLTEGE